MKKKILVDMSTTILHHGHIRLLKKASKLGDVYVALTTDKEVKGYKNYFPEIKYIFRKEILESIRYVKKVIPSKAIISEKFLKKNKIDIFVRGSDYKKEKFKTKTIIFSRTKNISSSLIRKKSSKIYKQKK
jgi:cytidyltransferase-like protein